MWVEEMFPVKYTTRTYTFGFSGVNFFFCSPCVPLPVYLYTITTCVPGYRYLRTCEPLPVYLFITIYTPVYQSLCTLVPLLVYPFITVFLHNTTCARLHIHLCTICCVPENIPTQLFPRPSIHVNSPQSIHSIPIFMAY